MSNKPVKIAEKKSRKHAAGLWARAKTASSGEEALLKSKHIQKSSNT